MKYTILLLLCALQANAEDLVCIIKGNEFLRINGLSRYIEDHQAVLRFVDAHPTNIYVNVTTQKAVEFEDWGGSGLKMDRVLEAIILPYPTFHFKLEIFQVVGGHCNQFDCGLSGTFYHGNEVEDFVCNKSVSKEKIL